MKKERMALFFFSSTRCLLGQGAPALQRLHQLLIDLAIALVQLNGAGVVVGIQRAVGQGLANGFLLRSEEHTSELQSPCNLVCRLLLEKKKNNTNRKRTVTIWCVMCLQSL